MSGIVGHTFYAVLGLKAAVGRKLPLAAIAHRHFASYVAGAYLGSDIQVMPEAICLDTGREVGFDTVPLERSPPTGGPVRQFRLATPEGPLTAYQVHERFYGRSHLVFGWKKGDVELRVPWDHLPDYFAAAITDAFALFGPRERPIAYALGWIVHVVSDSLIKSIQPGVDLQLPDGKYTTRNRPVQDLVTFHELGGKEFHLRWAALFEDLAKHAGRAAPASLHARHRAPRRTRAPLPRWLATRSRSHAPCSSRREPPLCPPARARSVGQSPASRHARRSRMQSRASRNLRTHLAEMLEAARAANFRHALWQIGEQIGEMFAAVAQRCAPLASLPASEGPSWSEITAD